MNQMELLFMTQGTQTSAIPNAVTGCTIAMKPWITRTKCKPKKSPQIMRAFFGF